MSRRSPDFLASAFAGLLSLLEQNVSQAGSEAVIRHFICGMIWTGQQYSHFRSLLLRDHAVFCFHSRFGVVLSGWKGMNIFQ